MTDAMSFTAIIRSLDKEDTIGRTIESIHQQSVKGRVLVVDSGSTDRTVEIARAYGADVIQIQPNNFTYGRAINIGVTEARTEFVIVLSAHCFLPSKDWASDAIATLRVNREMAALNGVQTRGTGDDALTNQHPLRALELAKVSGIAVQDAPWFSFSGFSNHGSLIRRDVALEHPFDETMAACEDKEWANRVVSTGHTIGFRAGMAVSGAHRRSAGLRHLYRRASKESESMSVMANRPATTVSEAWSDSKKAFSERAGLARFAPLRPANIVETCGRIAGSRKLLSASNQAAVGNTSAVRDLLSSILERTDGTVDLLNVPLHDNCGDSAIWLGQIEILNSISNTKVRYRLTNILDTHSPGEKSQPALALVRGGGYFGDLWPSEFHSFFDALTRYPDSPVVFMPQSVGALRTEVVEDLRVAIEKHGKVVLILRDRRSFDFASATFGGARTVLAPDSAHALDPRVLRRLAGSADQSLPAKRVIARHDSEGDGSLASLASASGFDVLDFVGVTGTKRNYLLRWLHELVRARFPNWAGSFLLNRVVARTRLYDYHARAELRRALQQIVGAEHIVTDRLHAAILASTLGIPTTIVDTGYGKLDSYFSQWPVPQVTIARDVESALKGIQN